MSGDFHPIQVLHFKLHSPTHEKLYKFRLKISLHCTSKRFIQVKIRQIKEVPVCNSEILSVVCACGEGHA